MFDIEILKELILKDEQVSLEWEYKKRRVTLNEPPPASYSVTIHGMPDEDEVIIIKVDRFDAPKSIFANSKSECKRADFVIIAETEKKKVVCCIELKGGKGRTEGDIVAQLRGSQCFVAYCRAIGQSFWGKEDFLSNYEYRFVSIKNISIPKKTTRVRPHENSHNQPDRMLKISGAHYIEFNHLI